MPGIALARALTRNPPMTTLPHPGIRNSFGVKYRLPSQEIAQSLMFQMDAPDLAQEVESRLAAMKNVSMVKVVEWKSENPWIDDDAQPLTFLLAKYGRFLGRDEYKDFGICSPISPLRVPGFSMNSWSR